MGKGKGAIAVLVMGMAFLTATVLPGTSVASVEVPTASGMLQFRAGGHLLGFAPGKAYLVALDHALSVEFLGGRGVMPKGDGDQEAKGSSSGAKALGEVVYENLWDGISLTYESTKAGITESTYHLAPGADVAKIRLKYNSPVEMQKDGSLQFRFDEGRLTESAPIAWQEMEGRRMPVAVAFKVSGNEVGFSVGKYDHDQPLVIDPTYSWHTFYGAGGGTTFGTGIAVDSSGNVYVTGYSSSSWGSPLHSGGNNFVLKLDSSGVRQWHTFYSGTSSSSDAGIAVDGSGNVYVTGYSYASWNGPGLCTVAGTSPCPLNAFSGSSGSYEIFVLKLDTNGAYQWHTFYGSSGYDLGHGVAVDGSGNVYVTGQSGASWGAPLHTYSGGWYNLFVLKLDTNGAYKWHTFYGSSNSNDLDYGNSIALDNGGNIYVAGKSDSAWGSPLHPHGGGTNVFILKLDNSGALLWNTFYISDTNHGVGLALDTDSNVYVTSTSTDWGSPLHGYSGSYDIIVLKLDSDGAYQWHTFYGSGDDEFGYGIAVDGSGNVYVTGTGNATWGSPLRAYSGNADAFLFKLDTNGAFKWNTFYGSGGGDEGWAVAVDTSGRVSLTGGSNATWGAPVNSFIGNEDVFVVRMNDSPPSVTTTSISAITNTTAASGGNVISDGGDTATARGVCWNTSINPTISNDYTTNGSGLGFFTSQIDSLSPVTTYHVRAYATNGGGTFYGEDISFTTKLCTSDVQRGGPYGTIQEAITSGSGAEIRAVARVFPEALLFSNSSPLALTGGYACGFGSTTGLTTVHGTITIAGSAAVTLGNLAVY